MCVRVRVRVHSNQGRHTTAYHHCHGGHQCPDSVPAVPPDTAPATDTSGALVQRQRHGPDQKVRGDSIKRFVKVRCGVTPGHGRLDTTGDTN